MAGDQVAEFAHRVLRPVEAVILARYREALSGRVLEVGCGAGRLLGYFVEMGGEVHGVDLSATMVAYCRRVYPEASVREGDLRELPLLEMRDLDAIFLSYNVLDVLDDEERRRVLRDVRAMLAEDGLLIFSSHNLGYGGISASPSPRRLDRLIARLDSSPSALVQMVRRLPARVRNRRRLQPLQRFGSDHAILNDEALDYGLLHYYIRRDDQERQLAQLGYELLECLDLEGRRVPPAADGPSPELHYVARRSR